MHNSDQEYLQALRKRSTTDQQIEQLVDRLLQAELIDLYLAADLLGSPLKVLRCDPDIVQHSSK